jgi:uncharacterized protein YjbJ (UPF0337 family)
MSNSLDGLKDKGEGKAEELGGRAKQGVGAATNDEQLENEGKADEAGGKAKQVVGELKDAVKDIKDNLSGS